jgi:hypothetical protein
MTPRMAALVTVAAAILPGCVPMVAPASEDPAAMPPPPSPSTGGQGPPANAGTGGAPAVTKVPDAAPASPADVAAAPDGVEAAAPPAGPASDPRGIVSAAAVGFQLMVKRRNADGSTSAATPFDVRGISWSPAERGANLPGKDAYLRAADRDLALMRAANINVVKTYLPVDRALLDKLLAYGIVAIVTVLSKAGDDFEGPVMELRSHPALLMWLVGNEWNYNRLYESCALDACYARVNAAAQRIKALDPAHPVATSFAPTAELPTDEDVKRLPAVDVFGLNVYSQPGFFNRFTNWRLLAQRTGIQKPIFFSEYGADAFDNRAGRPDEAAQAAALRRQTLEIRGQSSAKNPALPCLGGTPFEWNDEWWKRGSAGAQDNDGFANQGVAADQFANEEWWGVVDIDRKPRAAYQVLKELYAQ